MSEERIFNHTDQELMSYFRGLYAGKSTGYLMQEHNRFRYSLNQFHQVRRGRYRKGSFGRYDEDGQPTQEGIDMKRHERLIAKMVEGLLVSRGALKPRKHRRTFDRAFRKRMRTLRRAA